MQRGLGWIVHATHFFPVALFRQQFHRGLEAVDIQAQRPVEFGELPIGMFSNQAIIADHLAHNRAIFLFDKTLISFQIRPSSREGDLFLFTIGDHDLIDELSAVIGINPQNRKREQRACALEGSQHRLLAPMQEGKAFRPAGGYVGERQRVQVTSLDVGATMGHQVRFQKARSGLLPLLEGADRDLLLEQRSRSRRGEAALATFALGTQEAIRRRCAHGKQLAAALLGEVEMLMPLQRFDQRGEKRDEAFGADAVGGVPDQEQRVLDVWSVMAWAGVLRGGLHLFCMVEEPHRVLAIVSGRCRKGIKQLALLLDRRCLCDTAGSLAEVMRAWFEDSILLSCSPPLEMSCVRHLCRHDSEILWLPQQESAS